MTSSYFTESEAPRDFRVSSTESDGHYTKCLLCYTVKRNFYCSECIRTGNFVQSSMPYSDRYSEKQAKLLRLKANRKYILDRCEKLLLPKLKKDTLITEGKQSQDRLDLLRLAIEQRRTNIKEKRKQLTDLTTHNNDLKLKLPRYQKRVSTLNKHVQNQSIELQNKVSSYHEQAEKLAALRRSRIRHLTKYIFPVYMTYDTSDSIEDMEFIGSDTEEEPPKRAQLHIVAPWINTEGEGLLQAWGKEGGGGGGGSPAPACANWSRNSAGLALAAQLLTLLSWVLDIRLPHTLSINEYSNWRVSSGGAWARARRVCAAAAALAARAGGGARGEEEHLLLHEGERGEEEEGKEEERERGPHPHPLEALHQLTIAAATDNPALGRVDVHMEYWSARAAWCAAWGAPPSDLEDAEPEYLHWPDAEEMSEPPPGGTPPAVSPPPPAPAPSLVTSAAASLANMWRGWTK